MASWHLADGTVVTSGGNITGDSDVASRMRAVLEDGEAFVAVVAQPCAVAVDPNNDWLLDMFVRDRARRYEQTVTSDYTPRDEDIPPNVRDLLARRAASKPNPNAIY
jgi:hypothetical protein